MENKNKCFFSISLENGITITGKTPNETMDFLLDVQLLMEDAAKYNHQKKYQQWRRKAIYLERIFKDAWITITNHLQTEEK